MRAKLERALPSGQTGIVVRPEGRCRRPDGYRLPSERGCPPREDRRSRPEGYLSPPERRASPVRGRPVTEGRANVVRSTGNVDGRTALVLEGGSDRRPAGERSSSPPRGMPSGWGAWALRRDDAARPPEWQPRRSEAVRSPTQGDRLRVERPMPSVRSTVFVQPRHAVLRMHDGNSCLQGRSAWERRTSALRTQATHHAEQGPPLLPCMPATLHWIDGLHAMAWLRPHPPLKPLLHGFIAVIPLHAGAVAMA
jgi:hypothetical protein